ncbi:hypothetical protein [Streptomyces sp. EN23]|uniref:hypothetical protein n=1 Tax=Streptomyces sp. EN23 TaxID=212774 RepID=UPI00114CC1B0|nr:hypothetical protein [Streptomyces sp. EN23]
MRYHYSYAIFSTSGFTQDAQEFALAHQISLIDLSLPDFLPLRNLVRASAKSVYDAMKLLQPSRRPAVYEIRNYLRRHLLDLWDGPAADAPSVTDPLDDLAAGLCRRSSLGLVLAFPTAPFVLGLVSDDLNAFVRYALDQPTHDIRVYRNHRSAGHPVWQIEPGVGPAYRLSFSLPEQVEAWILDQEDRTRSAKRRIALVRRKAVSSGSSARTTRSYATWWRVAGMRSLCGARPRALTDACTSAP